MSNLNAKKNEITCALLSIPATYKGYKIQTLIGKDLLYYRNIAGII